MLILNLGCGNKTASQAEVVNIDWSIYLRIKSNPILAALAPVAFRGERLARFRALPDNIKVHNLAKGIPYPSDSADVVYHSHVLEHLDRPVAEAFLKEIHRVLKPGGTIRIVVPDLERICRDYLDHIGKCETDPAEAQRHERYIAEMLEQSVRREAYGTSTQPPVRRFIENLLLGDARRRGETHQWMYDRISLPLLLQHVGFREPTLETHRTSRIQNFDTYSLDVDEAGEEYKPGSIYVEAVK